MGVPKRLAAGIDDPQRLMLGIERGPHELVGPAFPRAIAEHRALRRARARRGRNTLAHPTPSRERKRRFGAEVRGVVVVARERIAAERA